jgi:hypothetical protein
MDNPSLAPPETPSSGTAARETLDAVSGLRRRTRRARQAFWFPLIIFGLLTLASGPLYAKRTSDWTFGVTEPGTPGETFYVKANYWYTWLGGVGGNPDATAIARFWLIGVPIAYVLTAAFYIWWAHRRGVATRWLAYVVTGAAVFTALALFVWKWNADIHNFDGSWMVYGLLPVVAIGLGFVVLAVVERDLPFALFAVFFCWLAVKANTYYMSNTLYRLGLPGGGGQVEVNAYVCGSVLLLAGIIFGLVAARTRVVRFVARALPMRRRSA